MPRKQAIQVDNSFVKGLITETTALNFPENACTETFNCVFDETGRITRRYGLEEESNPLAHTVTKTTGRVFTEYLWQAVGGSGIINFHVQQHGGTLYFYDLRSSVDVGFNKHGTSITLSTYRPTGSAVDASIHPCQYTTSNGYLIVVSEAINPIYITFDEVANTITATVIKPLIRDFLGLTDGLAISERSNESSLANLKTNAPLHAYNLYNQGWAQSDALTQWDTARSDFPSNADIVSLYRASVTDAFDNANVTSQSPGNTPAVRGHYILEAAAPDRVLALTTDGISGIALPGPTVMISGTVGTAFGDGFAPAGAFDTNNNSTTFKGSTSMYVGKNYSVQGGYRLYQAVLKSSNVPAFGFLENVDQSLTITIYGKNTAPANATDGTSLGTTTFNDTTSQTNKTIPSTDTANAYNYIWATFTTTPSATIAVATIEFYTFTSTGSYTTTDKRYRSCASYAGRVWYAGLDALNLNSSIFFSRIIEKPEQFATCHQANDPTSETNSDLLPDDGGVVRIPEMGSVIKLFPYQTSLLVFATNGVWRISGGQQGFAGNNYSVSRMSSIGTVSAISFVNYKGLPIWWGEDGIYTIKYEANYDSFSVTSITDTSIKSFVNTIPNLNKKYVKGVHDIDQDLIIWIYNDTASLPSTDYYKYNAAVCMNGLSQAFYPWSFEDNADPRTIDLRGIVYAIDGLREVQAKVKFVFTTSIDSSNESISFAETKNTNFLDWTIANYSSYFITGYKIHGETQKFAQPNYVFVFLDTLEDSSCYMQGVMDFTTSDSSGKWSTQQQLYNSDLTFRSVNYRRLKVRGKGRSIQLRFESETSKPFSIIGWSINESVNASI